MSITKALLLVGLVFSTISAASARNWYVKVEDDLFSETGKKAFLTSDNDFHPLIFECDSSGTEMALLEKSPQTRNETANNSSVVTLILKVDSADPIRFNASWYRRNENYTQIIVSDNDYAAEVLTVLKQIQAARSKILVGVVLPSGQKFSEAIGVSGSTASTTTFMDACGISTH
ncbi:hypothetical protein VRY85_09020 [Achromobacter sp. F4_2707]|uniref:hypothetical protein n=1 Tax=Achromobacter sp. F4_2707 TaxID=3114286 RepID=UPI0039C5FA5C